MAKIFISYRREDSQYAVDRIYEALRRRLKKRDIFMDVDDIPKGVDFVDYLSAKVAQCETLVAVIGPQWLSVTNKAGERRLDDPDDFVRIEIAAALKRGIPVVPVLLDGTPMPTAAQLPEDMRGFERRNGAEVHRRSLKTDIDALVSDLGYAGGGAPWGTIFRGGVVAAVAALGVFAWVDPLDVIPDPTPPAQESVIEAAPEPEVSLEDTTEDVETVAVEPIDPPDDSAARTEAIRGLQRALREMGLYTSVIDGDPGPGTRSAVSRFVSEYGGTQLDLATSSLSDIEDLTGRVEREVIAQGERDRAAWRVAEGVDTISAYRAYLSDYPSGTNASAARSRIEALTPAPAQAPPPPPSQSFRDRLSGGGQGPEMVVVPSGSFRMGSPSSEAGRLDREGPQRTVRINDQFAVGKYEVTWAEWEACVADGGCGGSGPEGAGGDEGWGKGSRPVINVSWEDAQAYTQWLSRKTGERYRLLSEAEWEYVARAGTTGRFSNNGGEAELCQIANGADTSTDYSWRNTSCSDGVGKQTAPVGSFRANGFGLYDVHGNVWEWVEDCYVDSYSGAPTDGSARLVSDCSQRVLRGGCWGNSPQILRSASRYRNNPTNRVNDVGFRVARTL